jgi:hypothetical protein
MATYYVDLARVGTGYSGTINDQFSQEDLITACTLAINNTFLIKGIGPLVGNKTFVIRAGNVFSPQINAPWRMRSTGTLTFRGGAGTGSAIVGGVIYAKIMCISMFIVSCLVKTPAFDFGSTTYYNSVNYLLGSHIIVSGAISLYNMIVYGSSSCIASTDLVSVDTPAHGVSQFIADYCAFTDTAAHLVSNGGTPVETVTLGIHNQYSWVCPAMPDVLDGADKFFASILSAGVTTPPQPGNIPYTDDYTYDTDPWGNPRKGIGFGWFRASYSRRMLFGVDGINLGALDPYEEGNWRITNPRLYNNQEFIAFEWYDYFNGIWNPQVRIPLSASVAIVQSGAPSLVGIDVSNGYEVYTLTLTENAKLSNPVGQYRDGQSIIIRVTQGGAGSYLLTYDTKFAFSAGLPAPTLSTAVGARDYLGFRYNSNKDTWDFLAVVTGF